jgi:tetratricopeptide (TPR) repeat protein
VPAARSPGLLLLVLGIGGAFALAGPLAGGARAADQRPVALPLASGAVLEGVVVSADEREVVLRLGPASVRRVPWQQLLPVGVYRAKAALAPPADGEARLALAELAVELGLYQEARVEYEKALALGALDRKTFDAVVGKAEQEAVETGVQKARMLAEAGDFESALETARELKLHFADASNAGAVEHLIAKLLADVSKLEKAADEDAAELEKIEVEARREKEILRRMTEASGLIQKGKDVAKDAEKARGIGNVTRARKYAEAADDAFMDARRHYGRLRRVLGREDPRYREVLAGLNELDRLQFRLLFETASFFWDQRVYSKAEEFAARASFIDPVHPDLLMLREMLRDARIRYRLSDVTNARPIVRGAR